MPKLPRFTPEEAEALLLKAGFEMVRSKGSHRIYMKGDTRVVVPFHRGRMLHPKIIKQVLRCVEPRGHTQETGNDYPSLGTSG